MLVSVHLRCLPIQAEKDPDGGGLPGLGREVERRVPGAVNRVEADSLLPGRRPGGQHPEDLVAPEVGRQVHRRLAVVVLRRQVAVPAAQQLGDDVGVSRRGRAVKKVLSAVQSDAGRTRLALHEVDQAVLEAAVLVVAVVEDQLVQPVYHLYQEERHRNAPTYHSM